MAQATLRFSVEVGMFLRRQFREQIEGFCVMRGLQYQVFVSRGLLSSIYYYRIIGSESDIRQLKNWIDYEKGRREK